MVTGRCKMPNTCVSILLCCMSIFLRAGLVINSSPPKAVGLQIVDVMLQRSIVFQRVHLSLMKALFNPTSLAARTWLLRYPCYKISDRSAADYFFDPDSSLPDFCLSSPSFTGAGQIPTVNFQYHSRVAPLFD
uniref:Secreted protein n=1 Tax=Molossus molossus TaxID=27622 RepID=A0A7J8CZ74_MOLMO|nr:hypothetical protein HJG59_009480 [Molossus molossus]